MGFFISGTMLEPELPPLLRYWSKTDGKGKICRIIRCAYACPRFSKLLQEYEAGGKDAVDDKIIHTLRKRFPTAKIMPDLLVEAQHSTVRIFEVMKAITEKKDKP